MDAALDSDAVTGVLVADVYEHGPSQKVLARAQLINRINLTVQDNITLIIPCFNQ